MGMSAVKNRVSTLATVASTAVSSTVTFTLPILDTYSIAMNVTTATGGTMDVVLQTSFDNGTTYLNLPLRFTQVATTTGVFWLTFKNGLGQNEIATESGLIAATGGSLAKNCVFNPDFMRASFTIATGPDAFTLYLFGKSLGAGAAI